MRLSWLVTCAMLLAIVPTVNAADTITISLAKSEYKITDLVAATVQTLTATGVPKPNDFIQVLWIRPDGEVARKDTGVTDTSGKAQLLFELRQGYPTGVWKIAGYAGNATTTVYFTVLPHGSWMVTITTYGVGVPIWVNGQQSAYVTNATFSLVEGNYTIELPATYGGLYFQRWEGYNSTNPRLAIYVGKELALKAHYGSQVATQNSFSPIYDLLPWIILIVGGFVAAILGLRWLSDEGYIG